MSYAWNNINTKYPAVSQWDICQVNETVSLELREAQVLYFSIIASGRWDFRSNGWANQGH